MTIHIVVLCPLSPGSRLDHGLVNGMCSWRLLVFFCVGFGRPGLQRTDHAWSARGARGHARQRSVCCSCCPGFFTVFPSCLVIIFFGCQSTSVRLHNVFPVNEKLKWCLWTLYAVASYKPMALWTLKFIRIHLYVVVLNYLREAFSFPVAQKQMIDSSLSSSLSVNFPNSDKMK